MYAIVRTEFKNSEQSREELEKILHGPSVVFIENVLDGDTHQSPALQFSTILNAKAWVALMEKHFNYRKGMLVGAIDDPLVIEFEDFRVPEELFTLICAVCDGRCVYEENEWKTINIKAGKARTIFEIIDSMQLEEEDYKYQ